MVKLYTKPKCPNCKQTKRVFKISNIDFVEINVMEDESAFNLVKEELGFTSLPVVSADGFEAFEYNKDKVMNFVKQYNS